MRVKIENGKTRRVRLKVANLLADIVAKIVQRVEG